MLGLEFFGWEVVEGGVQAFGVVPADPLDDHSFDLVSAAPRVVALDRFGFEGQMAGLSATAPVNDLVLGAKMRWRVEHD